MPVHHGLGIHEEGLDRIFRSDAEGYSGSCLFCERKTYSKLCHIAPMKNDLKSFSWPIRLSDITVLVLKYLVMNNLSVVSN